MSLSGARLPGALLGRASTPGTIKVHERDRASVFFRSPPITLPPNDPNSRETAWSSFSGDRRLRDLGARLNLGLGYGTVTHSGNHHSNIPDAPINFIWPYETRLEFTPVPPWPKASEKLQQVSRLSLKTWYLWYCQYNGS